MKKLLVIILFLLTVNSYGAFLFTNSTNNVQVADNAVLTLPDGDWSLAVKVDASTLPSAGSRIAQTVVNGTNMWAIYSYTDGSIEFEGVDGDGTNIFVTSAASVMDTSPRTIIVVRASDRIDVYYEGTSVANLTNSLFDAVDGGILYIGNRGGGTQNRPFDGSIAEFAKWDRALTAAEITAITNGFAPVCSLLPVVYIPMIRNFVELNKNLAITNNGASVVAHPRLFYCGE